MDELPDVPSLRVLEPPPGGLDALRQRLVTRRRRWWLLAVPALAVAAAIVLLLSASRTAPTARPPADAPPTAIRDRAVGDMFYWVASTPRSQRRPHGNVVSIDEAPAVTAYALP